MLLCRSSFCGCGVVLVSVRCLCVLLDALHQDTNGALLQSEAAGGGSGGVGEAGNRSCSRQAPWPRRNSGRGGRGDAIITNNTGNTAEMDWVEVEGDTVVVEAEAVEVREGGREESPGSRRSCPSSDEVLDLHSVVSGS